MWHLKGASHSDESRRLNSSEVEQAWKILSLVTEWLRHAEAKLGVILGFVGVSAGVLFNLVGKYEDGHWLFITAAAVSGVAALVAGLAALLGLLPIVRLKREARKAEPTINPLYFEDISSEISDGASYLTAFSELVVNSDDLVRHIGTQVFANARVASRKYRYAQIAMWGLCVDLVALGGAGGIAALG